MIKKNTKIYIAGHNGMVGSAVWRVLEKKGYSNLLGKTSSELDLRNQKDVYDFVSMEMPDVIIDAAARVGGILANNTYPYEFLMENMLIQNNLIKELINCDSIQSEVFFNKETRFDFLVEKNKQTLTACHYLFSSEA